MRRQLLRTAAAVALGGVLFNAAPARAEWPTFDAITHFLLTQAQNAITTAVGNVENAVTNIGATIGNKITGMQTSLEDVLKNGFTQNANYAKAQVGAQQQIVDASNTVNALFHRSVRNAQIRDEHTASPQFCKAADGGQAQVAASISSFSVARAISVIDDRRGEAVEGTPSYYGTAQGVQAINRLHWGRYCSAEEAKAGLCTQSSLPNADQQAANLFGTGTYDGQDAVNAANDVKTNLIQPLVPAALRGDQLTSTTGQEAAVRRRSYNARMSLAKTVLGYAVAIQTPSVALTTTQKAQLTAQGLPAPDKGSWLTAVTLEVNRRMADPGWHTALQAMPPASVQREIAVQMALSNYLSLHNYRVALYQAALSATRVAQTEEQAFQQAVQMPTPDMASN